MSARTLSLLLSKIFFGSQTLGTPSHKLMLHCQQGGAGAPGVDLTECTVRGDRGVRSPPQPVPNGLHPRVPLGGTAGGPVGGRHAADFHFES